MSCRRLLGAFFAARGELSPSHASFSIAGYVLGIGDRHLGNFLFRDSDCRIVGIDFGYAFDVGVSLPIPETIPFRLTPLFTNALCL